jgi:hypothetical protein
MKFKVTKTVKEERELDIQLPYYSKQFDYRWCALLNEKQLLIVSSIGLDYRNICLCAPSKSDIEALFEGKQITEQEFREAYDKATVDIDEPIPFKVAEEFPYEEELPY